MEWVWALTQGMSTLLPGVIHVKLSTSSKGIYIDGGTTATYTNFLETTGNGDPLRVSIPEDVDRMIAETLAACGRIDALVNNAGVNYRVPVLEFPEEEWDRIISTNLKGYFLTAQAVVINKIDLPAADVERVREEIDADLGLDPFEAIPVSAKTGVGIEDVLVGIVAKLPSPQGAPDAPLKALVFDAHFDKYRGVILQCRVMEGTLKTRDTIHFMHSGREFRVEELGYNQLQPSPQKQLGVGEVGYIVAGIKSVREIEIGDTITLLDRPAAEPVGRDGRKDGTDMGWQATIQVASPGLEQPISATEPRSVPSA